MFWNVKANVNMFTKTERRNWNSQMNMVEKCWRGDKHTHAQPHDTSCNFPFSVTLFIFYPISTALSISLFSGFASFSLSLFASLSKKRKMKNDPLDQGGRDKWPQKALPFELSSRFTWHQNTIVPKSKPPRWSKGCSALKQPYEACCQCVEGARASSSTLSSALSKSCMVKSAQSLSEYTKKDWRIHWGQSPHNPAHC